MTQAPLQIEKFIRKPFVVEAIEVTEANIHEVAAWCKGQVRTSDLSQRGGKEGETQKYIKVFVKRALSDKQTRAYYGDWVLKAGSGFKIYTPRAFAETFQKKVDHMMETVQRMDEREKREDAEEDAQFNSDLPDTLPTGGTHTSFITHGV